MADNAVEEDVRALMKRYPRNLDMRLEYRREYVYFLFLRGFKLEEIGKMVGISRSTVWEDLNKIRAILEVEPRSMEQIRRETLISMRLVHAEILRTIDEAKTVTNAKGVAAVRYDHVAKLYDVATQLDETILQRYTLPGTAPEITVKADEQILAMIDYLESRLGPEALTDFQNWWKGRMDVKKKIKDPP